MKTIIILKRDLILGQIVLDCITCDSEKVAYHIQRELKSLNRGIKEGFIDKEYRLEVVDKLRTTQMFF